MHTRHRVPAMALWRGQRGTHQSGEMGSGQAAPVPPCEMVTTSVVPAPSGVCSPMWTLAVGIKAYAPPFCSCRFIAPASEQNECVERAKV